MAEQNEHAPEQTEHASEQTEDLAEHNEEQVILVCEDDPMVAGFLQDVFRTAGHQVVSARDGESAVRMASELRPSVMTLDIDLPGLDGGAVISRLKADPSTASIPVIIISAHPGWLTFVERHQAVAVLEKPCPPWELQAAVEQALQGGPDRTES